MLRTEELSTKFCVAWLNYPWHAPLLKQGQTVHILQLFWLYNPLARIYLSLCRKREREKEGGRGPEREGRQRERDRRVDRETKR